MITRIQSNRSKDKNKHKQKKERESFDGNIENPEEPELSNPIEETSESDEVTMV